MTTLQLMLYALIAAGAITGLVVIVMLLHPWELFSSKTEAGQKNRYRIQSAYKEVALKFYDLLRNVPLARNFLGNIADTLKYRYTLEGNESKVDAASLIFKELIVLIISLIIFLRYFEDKLLALILVLMVVVYAYNKFMGDGQKFLEELEELIGDMVHAYNAGGQNIDRMFNRILDDTHNYLYKYTYTMNIYLKKALMEPEKSKEVIDEYNKNSPSRHLRIIFNYIYITSRYGDETNENGEKLFNKNMLAIQREVHADLARMKSIKDETLGEQIFIMFAVAMIPIVTWYMGTFFTFDGFGSIRRFLSSSFGYSIKLICAIVSLICFYLYTRLMESNIAFENRKTTRWADYLLEHSRLLRNIVDKVAPDKKSDQYNRLYNDLVLAEGYANIRAFYLKKILISIVATLIVAVFLSLDTYTLYYNIRSDMYVGVNGDIMDIAINASNDRQQFIDQSLANDQFIMGIISEDIESYNQLNDADKQQFVYGIIRTNSLDYGAYPELAVQRVIEKQSMMKQVDIVIIIIASVFTFIASYFIPNLTLILSITLNQGAIIYDEVIGYYTVVILLVNHSASNIYMLFDWITSFATIFKGRLQQCKDNLCEKEIKALEKGIEYKPLSRLIECLLLAYNGADMQSAFAGIEQRQLFQEESRRMLNDQIIKRRISYSQALSWFALGCTFILYVVTPMIMAIIEMLGQVM